MSGAQSWMLYGATGHTGALIARHARERGHRPMLAGRNVPAITGLAERLDLPHRAVALDDLAALTAALADADLVLNAAGPFLHTAAPLAEACLAAGVHYLDIGNELQVFLTLYDLDQRARRSGPAVRQLPAGAGQAPGVVRELSAYAASGGTRQVPRSPHRGPGQPARRHHQSLNRRS
jgi:short subunit dehydrogenase-like uncharacterized protein